jgi:hypothetical protein
MAHRHLLVKGGQGSGKGGGGIPLDDHQPGRMVLKLGGQPRQATAGNVSEALLGLHNGQVRVRLQSKQGHHLIHHFPMLTGEHHSGFEGGIPLK